MAQKVNKPLENQRKLRPATTPDGRQKQNAMLAVDLVEQRLRDGTATSQETTFYLKLASPVEDLKQKKLEKEIELIEAKIDAIHKTADNEALYLNAINALRKYSGEADDDEYQ